MYLKKITHLLSTLCLCNISFSSDTGQCEAIIFENIGYCKNPTFDLIVMETDETQMIPFFKNSNYALNLLYPDQDSLGSEKNQVFYFCKDSFDLDLLREIVNRSALTNEFVRSGLISDYSNTESETSLANGSFQIRAYAENGVFLESHYVVGLKDLGTWILYILHELKISLPNDPWGMEELIYFAVTEITENCTD